MKKVYLFFVAIMLFAVSCDKTDISEDVSMKQLDAKVKDDCTTIPSGELYTSSGELITPGFMDSGYNYQSHLFNGDVDGWHLVMKWNDAWLSNQDCDNDGKLDRPLDENGNEDYIGSGAWVTNHWTITYTDEGNECEYDYFIKIIAVPEDATKTDGVWYNGDGTEIGPDIWGQFAIIQEVENDPCNGIEGVQYKSPDHPGLGNW